MVKRDVLLFLKALGVQTVSIREPWITASCPMAPWTHKNGTDNSKSFGIKISEDRLSGYNCYACASSGPLVKLLSNMFVLSGNTYGTANWLAINEMAAIDAKKANSTISIGKLAVVDRFADIVVHSIAPSPVVSQNILDRYAPVGMLSDPESMRVENWLVKTRDIKREVLLRYGCRVFREEGRLGVVFPLCNRDGKVIDLRVRMIDDKQMFRLDPKHTGSKVAYKAQVPLFGWQFVDQKTPLTIVEGELDCMRVASFGTPNVVAICGGLSSKHLDAIYHHKIVLGLDSDESGELFTAKAAEFFLSQKHVTQLWSLDWSLQPHRNRDKKSPDLMAKDPCDLVDRMAFIRVVQQKRELK